MNMNHKMHFEVSERKVLLKVFDVVFVLGALYLAGLFFDLKYLNDAIHNRYSLALLAVYVSGFGTIFEMYNLQVARDSKQVLKSIILTASSTFLMYFFTQSLSPELSNNRLQLVVFYSTILIALFVWRTLYVKFFTSNRFIQEVLLICQPRQVDELVADLEKSDPHYRVIAYINYDGDSYNVVHHNSIQNICIDNLGEFISKNKVSEIIIAAQNSEFITPSLHKELFQLLALGITIRDYTQVYEDKTQRIPLHHIDRDFYKYFLFNRINSNRLYLLNVRIMETIISIVGIIIGLLLIPIIMLGNAIGNRGKLFFTQERVGHNGTIFQILKFRSMVNTEKETTDFSTSSDCRITTFGKFLRKTRIDEIPQFVNILKGEMAVIGPRPDVPSFVKEISDIMPIYETRHAIKPGLTGWAQVNYSYGESIEESLIKLQYDLYYIKHRSIFLDLNISIKTFSTILFCRGQ